MFGWMTGTYCSGALKSFSDEAFLQHERKKNPQIVLTNCFDIISRLDKRDSQVAAAKQTPLTVSSSTEPSLIPKYILSLFSRQGRYYVHLET